MIGRFESSGLERRRRLRLNLACHKATIIIVICLLYRHLPRGTDHITTPPVS